MPNEKGWKELVEAYRWLKKCDDIVMLKREELKEARSVLQQAVERVWSLLDDEESGQGKLDV